MIRTIYENTWLKLKVKELKCRVHELQSELEEIRTAYRNLLVTRITENKININEMGPFLPEEEVQKVEKQILTSPADVDVYFFPSGWMGDGEYGQRYITFIRIQGYIKITYRLGPKGCAGIYWQFPEGNWGEQPGRNLSGAQKLIFLAKGETGNEIIEFKAGGIRGHQYQDSFEKSLGRIKLSQIWKQYEINLTNQNLSNVIGAFAWIATKDANPHGLTFYIMNIYYEE